MNVETNNFLISKFRVPRKTCPGTSARHPDVISGSDVLPARSTGGSVQISTERTSKLRLKTKQCLFKVIQISRRLFAFTTDLFTVNPSPSYYNTYEF